MYSHSGSIQSAAAAERPQLWLATLHPGIVPALAADALDKIQKRLWYLAVEEATYRIDCQPNLNQMLVTRVDAIRQEPEWNVTSKVSIAEAALIEFFKRMRPGDPATLENAKQFLEEQLFDQRHYDLERVGRYKLNQKLDLQVPIPHRTVTKSDVIRLLRRMMCGRNRVRPVIARIEDLASEAYGGSDKLKNVAFRVIADHSRATSFLIADGVLPSNEGRGYVLRRIIRRALRFGRLLNLKTPFLPRVCQGVVELMGEVYPELTGAHSFMHQIVTNEEERFADTLDHGLKLLHEELAALKTASGQVLSGEVAFKLYDTYGFPLDLVQDALREEGLNLDYTGYEEHMRSPAKRANAAAPAISATAAGNSSSPPVFTA